jgi:hypothetical protein
VIPSLVEEAIIWEAERVRLVVLRVLRHGTGTDVRWGLQATSMEQIKSVDNRMTERSWEDKSRQEEHGAIPSGNFSHPAQLKCSLGKQLYLER